MAHSARGPCLSDFLTALAGSGGHAVDSDVDRVIEAVSEGFLAEEVADLVDRSFVVAADLDRLVIPYRGHNRLSSDQSDRLVRVLRVTQEATDVFINKDKARNWLNRPTPALGGRAPIDLLSSDVGGRRVETVLGQIANGIPPSVRTP